MPTIPQKQQRHGGNRGAVDNHRKLKATNKFYRHVSEPSSRLDGHTTAITGRIGERGPRVLLTLLNQIDGTVIARVEIKAGAAAIIRAAEVLGLEAVALETLANLIADNEVIGEHGLERLRIARERIAEAKEALVA